MIPKVDANTLITGLPLEALGSLAMQDSIVFLRPCSHHANTTLPSVFICVHLWPIFIFLIFYFVCLKCYQPANTQLPMHKLLENPRARIGPRGLPALYSNILPNHGAAMRGLDPQHYFAVLEYPHGAVGLAYRDGHRAGFAADGGGGPVAGA